MADRIVPLLCKQRTWDQICGCKMVYSWHPFLWKHKTMQHMNRETIELHRTPRKKIFITFIGFFCGENNNNTHTHTHLLLHTKKGKLLQIRTLVAKHHFLFLSGIFNPSGSVWWNHWRPDPQVSVILCGFFWANVVMSIHLFHTNTPGVEKSRDPYLELRQRYASSWKKRNHRLVLVPRNRVSSKKNLRSHHVR